MTEAAATVTEQTTTALFRESSAVFSPCRTYRYRLTRTWATGPLLGYVMLNPSTADAFHLDHTLRRCIGFAKSWGYAGVEVHNLFALRATNPAVLYEHHDPVGPLNDQFLRDRAGIGRTICAWGVHGTLRGRDRAVTELLRRHRLEALGFTRDGHPRHPLRMPATTRPVLYRHPPAPPAPSPHPLRGSPASALAGGHHV